MEFIETPVFTAEVRRLLADEEYRSLQLALALRPQQGMLIRGSGGLRKVRWKAKGKGKSGGVRVIYYWLTEEATIYLLMAFGKSAQETLSPAQVRTLSKLVKEELG